MGRNAFFGKNVSNDVEKRQNGHPNNMIENVFETFIKPANNRVVYLHGDVDESNIGEVQRQLFDLSIKSRQPITIVISTYGGSMDEMFSLYDVINMLKCPVRTVGLGKIMSAGVLLLASGEKGTRLLGKNSRIMIHPIWSSASGNVFEMMNESLELERCHEQYLDVMVSNTKMDRIIIESMMKEKIDQYITPEQAIKLGIVDKIV
jgi:ATP-dependent Clp protease protease subunit